MVILFAIIYISPRFITNKIGEFQLVMNEFVKNEENALWIYKEDLSHFPDEKIQTLIDRLDNEGILLWDKNIELLESLKDLPPFLQERVDILNEYCQLRKESFKLIKLLLLNNSSDVQNKLLEINKKIALKLNDLQKLNE